MVSLLHIIYIYIYIYIYSTQDLVFRTHIAPAHTLCIQHTHTHTHTFICTHTHNTERTNARWAEGEGLGMDVGGVKGLSSCAEVRE